MGAAGPRQSRPPSLGPNQRQSGTEYQPLQEPDRCMQLMIGKLMICRESLGDDNADGQCVDDNRSDVLDPLRAKC